MRRPQGGNAQHVQTNTGIIGLQLDSKSKGSHLQASLILSTSNCKNQIWLPDLPSGQLRDRRHYGHGPSQHRVCALLTRTTRACMTRSRTRLVRLSDTNNNLAFGDARGSWILLEPRSVADDIPQVRCKTVAQSLLR